MPRDISEFFGDSLIIGGGWCEGRYSMQPSLRNPGNFYTIDIESEAKPDAVIDITDETQSSILPSKRFSFIFFEYFPWQGQGKGEELMIKTFTAAARLLKPDGVLLYKGGDSYDGGVGERVYKSEFTIPELLKKSGFNHVFTKQYELVRPDRGCFSIATHIDPRLINIDSMQAETIKLNHKQLFIQEPLDKPVNFRGIGMVYMKVPALVKEASLSSSCTLFADNTKIKYDAPLDKMEKAKSFARCSPCVIL